MIKSCDGLTNLKVTYQTDIPISSKIELIIEKFQERIKQIDDILAADYIASRTVTAYADWTGLITNMKATGKADDLLTDAVTNYICTVKLYIKTAV